MGFAFGKSIRFDLTWPGSARAAGCRASLAASVILLFGSSAALAQTPVPGDFVLNEIHTDPAPGLAGDANGDGVRDPYDDEFVELINITAGDLDVSGLTIERDVMVHHIFATGTVIPPGCAVVVFGGGTPTGVFGGAVVQTASSGGLSLVNGGSTVTLMNGATEIALFHYGFTGCEGDQDQSVNLSPELTPSTCMLHSQVSGSGGTLYSPGTWVDGTFFGDCGLLIFSDDFESGTMSAWSDSEPSIVAINEIMQNPSVVPDSSGEWFEIFNPGASDVDINGWTISDANVDTHVINNAGPLVVPVGGFIVLGIEDNPSLNGGVTVNYVYSGISLANSSDQLALNNDTGGLVDVVAWDNGVTFPDPNGASMALASSALDNSLGENWCISVSPFGDGDLGTPGILNDPCP